MGAGNDSPEFVMGLSRANIFAPVSISDIKILKDCALTCRIAAKACIQHGFKKVGLICIECAEVCDLTIKFKSCRSEFLSEVLKLYAHICQKCAEECSKVELEQCQKCAEACKNCLKFIVLQHHP